MVFCLFVADTEAGETEAGDTQTPHALLFLPRSSLPFPLFRVRFICRICVSLLLWEALAANHHVIICWVFNWRGNARMKCSAAPSEARAEAMNVICANISSCFGCVQMRRRWRTDWYFVVSKHDCKHGRLCSGPLHIEHGDTGRCIPGISYRSSQTV